MVWIFEITAVNNQGIYNAFVAVIDVFYKFHPISLAQKRPVYTNFP